MPESSKKVREIVEKELEFMDEDDLKDYYRDVRGAELFLKDKKELDGLYSQVMGHGTPDPI